MNENEPQDFPFHDGVLELVVDLINRIEEQSDGRVSEGITLCVKGMLISGIIISRKEFLRSHPVVDEIGESIDRLQNEGKIPKPSENDPICFIHLKNARVFAPGAPPIPTDKNGTYWRGRLDSIDGFFLGRLEHRP